MGPWWEKPTKFFFAMVSFPRTDKVITGYFAHAQTVSTRPHFGGRGLGMRLDTAP